MAVGSHRSEELNVHEKRVLIVTFKGERLALGALDFLDDQIGMQLDPHVAGSFRGYQFDFGCGGKRLADGIERCRNVVVRGEKINGTRRLSMNRCGSNE